jgi:hypothetical protein
MDESVGPFVEHPARNPPRAMRRSAAARFMGKFILAAKYGASRGDASRL